MNEDYKRVVLVLLLSSTAPQVFLIHTYRWFSRYVITAMLVDGK